jgi:hypothetical protein
MEIVTSHLKKSRFIRLPSFEQGIYSAYGTFISHLGSINKRNAESLEESLPEYSSRRSVCTHMRRAVSSDYVSGTPSPYRHFALDTPSSKLRFRLLIQNDPWRWTLHPRALNRLITSTTAGPTGGGTNTDAPAKDMPSPQPVGFRAQYHPKSGM